MYAQCTPDRFELKWQRKRRVMAGFTGERVTSDFGGVLLREVEGNRQLLSRLADCFVDHRDDRRIEHTVAELVAQRVFGLALGYEDLNDHDRLRDDPLLALLVGKTDVLGDERGRARDQGAALAGKSTLNRLELAQPDANADTRYCKIVFDGAAIDRLLVDVFIEAFETPPAEIVLDLDATDDPLHGKQEGRFFHGYYRHYCYLPLYIFCGDFPLCARLRTSKIDGAAGTIEELERIVPQIRQAWPDVRIIVRADSGFARDHIMAWCEDNAVDFVLGLARNKRLRRRLSRTLRKARRQHLATGQKTRLFRSFSYRTKKSWTCARRVVGKAEHTQRGENPRYVVTSISPSEMRADVLYTKLYCARGEMENRIKEQQLDLFADRTSTSKMRSNQLRLYFSTFGYLLISELRRLGLSGTKLARAYVGTIRNKLFKIGASILVSTRRVFFKASTAYPDQGLFVAVLERLKRAPPRPT